MFSSPEFLFPSDGRGEAAGAWLGAPMLMAPQSIPSSRLSCRGNWPLPGMIPTGGYGFGVAETPRRFQSHRSGRPVWPQQGHDQFLQFRRQVLPVPSVATVGTVRPRRQRCVACARFCAPPSPIPLIIRWNPTGVRLPVGVLNKPGLFPGFSYVPADSRGRRRHLDLAVQKVTGRAARLRNRSRMRGERGTRRRKPGRWVADSVTVVTLTPRLQAVGELGEVASTRTTGVDSHRHTGRSSREARQRLVLCARPCGDA